MLLANVERYAIYGEPDGLRIEMRQAVRCLMWGALIFAGISTALVRIGFDGIDLFGWCLVGGGTLLGLMVLLAAFCDEDWWFRSDEIRYASVFPRRDDRFPRRSGSPVTMRVELRRDSSGDTAILGHVLRPIGPKGEDLGGEFAFESRANLDRFLDALRSDLPIEVENNHPRDRKPRPKLKGELSWWDREDVGLA